MADFTLQVAPHLCFGALPYHPVPDQAYLGFIQCCFLPRRPPLRVDDGHGGSVTTTVFTQQRGQVHLPRARSRQQVRGRLDGGVALHQVAGHGQGVLHLLQTFQYVSVRLKVRRRFRHRERGFRGQTQDVVQTGLKTDLNDALETKHDLSLARAQQ